MSDLEPEAPAPARNRKRLIVVAVVVVLVLGGIAYALTSGGSEKKPTIVGVLQLHDQDSVAGHLGDPCQGRGGYSDIRDGTTVTVSDGDGHLLATSHLESGSIDAAAVCGWTFTVTDVPKAAFYKIEVSHRGGLTYSYADLKAQGFAVVTTLGS